MNHAVQADYLEAVKQANQSREMDSDRLSETKELIENGMASAARHRGLEEELARLEAAEDRMKKPEDWDFFYGYVFASSRYRIASIKFSLGWGLIEVSPESINTVCKPLF